MERQLSNVSFHSYQDYQPARRYGPQYEPGGYATAVQQRSNMTQREDALKFEQGRIKALQEERLHIQKKTFTKWMNSFLQKARMEVEDLFVDLADGRRLLKLLEIISGERLPRPNSGRMRVHKIENVNKSLSFLHTKVRLESIGAEDIVDGNPRLILGLIWTIILRFQIQEIEIDVDEENESSEKKSAKDALLLWCQRKTSGYHGVHIHNFTDCWRSGLGFNALIHSHRPDLFRWSDLPVADHVETLNHAFDVAHTNLGIPKLLDAEDVDTTRPDEKSVMTYVASYYHTFARMKNEQKSGRRIANIIGQLMDVDARKNEYSRLVSALLEWIRLKMEELGGRDFPNSLDSIQRLLLAFKQYRTVEKPPKYKERSEIEALFFSINTLNKSLVGEPWAPLEGQLPQDLERAWQQLEQAEHAREIALRTELLRQQRLEQLNYKFNTKSVLRKGYLKEMIQVLSDPRYGSNLAQVDATVKKHEAISADILARFAPLGYGGMTFLYEPYTNRKERFEDLSAMAAELVREGYHGAATVQRTSEDVLGRWEALLQLLERHRAALAALAALTALLREADGRTKTVHEMKAQFHSEEVGRHLSDVERLLQAHALQELQLGALDEAIRGLVRRGAAAEGPEQPKLQLQNQLTQLEDQYDSLVAAAKDRKARLEDARNLYQFLEDHDEEEGWVTEKQRICRAEVAAKDLRGVHALRQKHTALVHELRARDHVSQRHRVKGQGLIDAKHPKSAEIERRLSALNQQWATLRELCAAREKQLADAAEVYQFYGDANEADSWMKEKRVLLGSADCGGDAPSAQALLARHRVLHEQLAAYKPELAGLRAAADRLAAAGTIALQLPTEVEAAPAAAEEEWGTETRLVPTEVWEEQPVERLEHRTVTEERSVPQVKALYAFSGQGISMAKGEVMFLISKSNPDWWSVRKPDRTDGFVPANYVREIEPRHVPVQVRRPEKVRTIQRVKKTVLVKQVVPTRRPAPQRRTSRPAAPPAPTVPDRMQAIQDSYDDLLKLSEERRLQLEDAIKLFSLFAECEDLERWMKDKERLLKTEDADTVDNAKRKYEKFVTDLSAASRRLEHIEAATDELVKSNHGQAAAAVAARQQLQQQWQRLLRLKQHKERSLEGASSVELFGRTCDEALDWMAEKEEQLRAAVTPAADLRTVQALQRRHAQLERELEPLREKVATVTLLADSVKSQYPSEKANVEARQKQIQEVWARCEEEAASRRTRLESAVGHQIFGRSSAQLHDWLLKTQEQLSQDASAKDVATAEELHKQHQEMLDDIRAHDDEFKEVIALGQQLVANNPTLTDVADRVKQLTHQQKAVKDAWQAKEDHLQYLAELAAFNREADRIDATSGAHQAYLDYTDTGSSVDSAEALLRRHEELEARLAAHDERLAPFHQRAARLAERPHADTAHITARQRAVGTRRDAVRQAAAERRRALHASLAHHQFLATADELQAWIQDKTRVAKDQSYRDLANLERKLQKHEAFERELQANEKQLRNIESVGQSLQKSDAARAGVVGQRLQALQAGWASLLAASRDKGSKLRQAHAQRAHKRAIEDAKARLVELERALASEETGTDLRSCKRLLARHQALEQEHATCEQKAASLAASGQDLVSGGHFDAPAIEKSSRALLQAARGLKDPAAKARSRLETTSELHKFASEVASELDWISGRRAAAEAAAPATDLHGAQLASKRHAKLRAELQGRRPHVEKVLQKGQELQSQQHPDTDKITELSEQLEKAYSDACAEAEGQGGRVEAELKAQQLLHEALEVDAWLADKAAALADPDTGRDLHRATALLTRHKAVELELDTYSAIIAEMGRAAASMAAAGRPEPQERLRELGDTLQRLQRLAQARQKALVNSVCRHEYLAESAELESWIQEQLAAASSEDYGQDYEHLLILRSKFEELRHRVETGAERFNQCEELAKKLLASDSPHIDEIEQRQETVGESWQRLVDQIAARASRLHAAGDIHRFHRDVAELLARAADATARTQHGPYRDAHAQHAAIDAQVQVLQEEGERLIKLYPGGNVQQIELQQRALAAAWRALHQAAADSKERQQQKEQLQHALTQIRDLSSWSAGVRAAMAREARVRDAAAAQALRADHDALKAEIEARDDSFQQALQSAQEMVQNEHPAAQEIEEKSEALLAERSALHAAWAARQVALDQLIDLHCFLRDAQQLQDLCSAQETVLGSEISPTLSVEEVDKLLKKHEAFEKLLLTQDEKLSTLNTHGDKLLQQNHVESQRIADELRNVNQRRKKIHELSAQRRSALRNALTRAQLTRDVGEVRAWLAGKLQALNSQQQGEVTSLEDKIKKLQKHQAFTAELAANEPRLREVEELAARLQHGQQDQHEAELQQLRKDWRQLLLAAEQRGRGLEEAQDILEFEQQLDKIEAWIRDKEMMVQAHELGRDYEHCSALLRKLDDLDSDMKVDDKRVKSICQLADKLLADKTQGPTSHLSTVAARRDALLRKWRALSGALKQYRERLAAALDIHAFHRDVQDTQERIDKKAALFSSEARGRSLAGAHELRRRHDALAAEARAVYDKIKALNIEGKRLAQAHPDSASEIDAALQQLKESGKRLEQLAAARSALLDEAIAAHKFDESFKELELWVGETVKRLQGDEPATSVAEAEAALQLHRERKAEIDGRQKSIAALQKQAEEQQLPELPEKRARLQQLSTTLDHAWKEREQHLTQAHQSEILNEQAQQVEDWLAGKEAFLNNDDLGDDLEAVEALIAKHEEFSKLLGTQGGKVAELEARAPQVAHAQAKRRVADLLARAHRLKESCAARGAMLTQSRQLQQFLEDLRHERDWIQIKMQLASEQNYRELSNLQSKIQKHEAFEAELAANKGRIDAVANTGETLIEAKHYAAREIATLVEDLEGQWAELVAAARLRRDRLQEAYQARVYLRDLDEFAAWLDDTEAQLLSEDLGSDLAMTDALLKRHARLEQQAAGKADTATHLADTARQLADSRHFMADELLERADLVVTRYKQLSEPMQLRRANLQDAAQLRRWERDAEEEAHWLAEREPALSATDCGETLPEAQKLHKKHLALEAELVAREPAITSLCQRGTDLARRGHFAAASLESQARNLATSVKRATALATARTRRLQRAIDTLQLVSEISESLSWARERRDALLEPDTGRDEQSVLLLQRRLAARQREIAQLDATLPSLEKAAAGLLQHQEGPTPEDELVSTRLAELKGLHEEMKLLSARREQRLQQSLNYFKFAQECADAQEWIGEQMSVAASEEYGLDVEHVETLQQSFDNFLQQLQANEGRIEAVCEAGQALLEENTPEQERVRQKMDDVRGLWEDLRELALARQEALAGARQVHEFDRSADEAVAWIEQKEQALGGGLTHGRRRALQALRDDLAAIRDRREELARRADSLGQAFPDAKEHVTCKLEQVTEALTALTARASDCEQQLQLAQQLEAFFGTCQSLLAWTNETIARVTAPELAGDVAGAERLVARHQDICAEIQARDDAFQQLYAAADKLISEGHFMSAEITSRLGALRARRHVLDAAAARRGVLYAQHLDALVFKRDADALEHWIQTRVPLVRDGKLGESVSQVEELINRHRDLEETIEAQKERFEALRRLTLVEQAFKEQQQEEAAARAAAAKRAAQETAEQSRRREVQRIQEQRRRTHAEHTSSEDTLPPEPVPEPPSPTQAPVSSPQSAVLPAVKRAESMQVSTKAPKRTPSFTTRRRTQSFRRHRRPDGAELPPLEIEGFLERKQVAGNGGARATVRSWRGYHAVLCGQLLCFFRDEQDFANSKAAAPPVAIANARCSIASDYTKRAHVFRLSLADGAEYLFGAASRELMQEWIDKLSFHAALPPQLQLTPYSPAPEPAEELKRRLLQNASSSSEDDSPQPTRKPRSQAEILHEHRQSHAPNQQSAAPNQQSHSPNQQSHAPNQQSHAPHQEASESSRHSQRTSVTSTGTIESTVLPSLPPRHSEGQEDDNDVIMRNSGQPTWGRSRFSNGRDINTDFIRSQQADSAPPLPSSGPPAIPERGPNIPERQPTIPERNPSASDRQAAEKQSVTALVNSYQQRMSRGSDNNNAGRNSGWLGVERQNNNWQETNTQFYSSSDVAYGGAAGSTRPASVAGGGSPALDQRPASRSSGESELSLGGNTREKKDKKGVFGGLFSRKKRPQSHM